MNSFLSSVRAAVMATLVLTVVTCGVYPLIVWGIARIAFPSQASGSLIVGPDGTVRGSGLIAQGFTSPKYFHPRPSSAGANGYDATSSGGSNFGPTSQKLRDAIQERVAAYRQENGLKPDATVPADAVTASASGLDPHISVQNARFQSARVAAARHISVASLEALIQANTDGPSLGILGEPGVRVLELNLALDRL
jgi:K+-transporting ATPase ATPase C chain